MNKTAAQLREIADLQLSKRETIVSLLKRAEEAADKGNCSISYSVQSKLPLEEELYIEKLGYKLSWNNYTYIYVISW